MINIGFSGSRDWGDPLLPQRKIRSIINRLAQKYPVATLHVGDARGVDEWVIEASRSLFPMNLYGVNGKWRNIPDRALLVENCDGVIEFIDTVNPNWKIAYLRRDEVMVNHVDILIAIWNGTSRGTKYTFDYAETTGKKAFMCRLVDNRWEWS